MSCMCPHDVDCEMMRKVAEAEQAIEGTERERDEAWERAEKAEAEAARMAAALRDMVIVVNDLMRAGYVPGKEDMAAISLARVALAAAPQARKMAGAIGAAIKALAGLFALIEAGDLVRDTSHDDDGATFIVQELRIVMALKRAQEALAHPALKGWLP